jgi:hypothetical protein
LANELDYYSYHIGIIVKKVILLLDFKIKACMDYKPLLQRVWKINRSPELEWKVIAAEPGSLWHLKKFAIPFAAFIAAVTLLGNFFIMGIHDFSFAYIFVKSIISFLVSFFSMFVSALIMNEVVGFFDVPKNTHKIFKLFIYSFTAFWTASAIAGFMANYITLGKFLKFMGLYGIYPYWIGVTSLLGLKDEKRNTFIVISLIVVVSVYLLITWSLKFVLNAVYYASMIE